mmetsp:Transcript_124242/g.247587  ORF Transcript_124242/g.247587 Transcript_124242/m.247587 type:complete len:224 (+) Transcript_124242:273-944(+)
MASRGWSSLRWLGGLVPFQLPTVSANWLASRLVMRAHTATIEPRRTTHAPLIIPNTAVDLRRPWHAGRSSERQTCCCKRLLHTLVMLFVKECVEVALSTFSPNKLIVTRGKPDASPTSLHAERHVVCKPLCCKQKATVGPDSKEPYVEWFPCPTTCAEEVASRSTLEHWPQVPLQLNILIKEGNSIILIKAQDMEANQVLGATPPISLAWPPIAWIPFQSWWQ